MVTLLITPTAKMIFLLKKRKRGHPNYRPLVPPPPEPGGQLRGKIHQLSKASQP